MALRSATDFSKRALALCKLKTPEARIEWADMRERIPFAADRFGLILADLSMHYKDILGSGVC